MNTGPRDVKAMLADLVKAVLEGDPGDAFFERLDGVQASLFDEILPGQLRATEGTARLPQFRLAVDAYRALLVVDPADPAIPWNLGSSMVDSGRLLDAGYLYLEAARRMAAAPASEDPEDDAMWLEAAKYHAALTFANAGEVVTAAFICRDISDDEYRDEVVRVLEERVRSWPSDGDASGPD